MNFNSKYKALLASVRAALFTNLLHLWIDHDIDDTKYYKFLVSYQSSMNKRPLQLQH